MDEQLDGGPFQPASKTITLSRPITVGGKSVSEIILMEPTLDQAEFLDMIRLRVTQEGVMDFGGMGTTSRLALVHLGGLTDKEAGQIRACDVMSIWTAVMGFLTNSRKTGASSLQ